MADQQSIVVIFDLLNNSAPVTPGVRKTIDNISKTYPYFIPARYVKALDTYRKDQDMTALSSIISGYTGNWLLFSEFLNASPPIGSTNYQENYSDLPPVDDANNLSYEKKKETSVFDEPASYENLTLPVRKGNSGNNEPQQKNIDTESKVPFNNDLEEVEDAIIEDAVIEEVYDTKDEEEIITPSYTDDKPVANEQENTVEEPQDQQSGTDDTPVNYFVSGNEEQSVETNDLPETQSTGDDAEPVKDRQVPYHSDEEVHHPTDEIPSADTVEELVTPVYTEDYFMHQGVPVSSDVPNDLNSLADTNMEGEEDKSLMVMMSFQEWLLHFKHKEESQSQEQQEQKALKTMWQKEKLAAALEEENDEIPEEVFDLAMNSIAREDGLASESLADIYIKQGKYDRAIEMLQKLSLRNPEKNTYFAQKIEEIKKEKLS